jgi:preprotein translocase subunit SecE
MAASPAKFIREVRQEAHKVTWATRKETIAATGMVMFLVVIAAIFFFITDWIFSTAIEALLGI